MLTGSREHGSEKVRVRCIPEIADSSRAQTLKATLS